MPVVIAIVIATLLLSAVLFAVEWSGRGRDPADVRVDVGGVVEHVQQHPPLRRFMLKRINPDEATGLLLTVALLVIAITTITVGLVLEMVQTREGFARWDAAAARWGARHTTGTTETIVRGITQLGSTTVVIGVCVVVAIIEYRRIPSRAVPIFLASVAASELVVNNLIKVVVGRDRPHVARLVHASGFSFPSGHTAAAAATYAAVALLLGRRRRRSTQALLAAAAAGLTVAVASSRVLLGAHWLTDVIAGAAVGWSCFALCSIAFGGRLLQFGQPIAAARATLDPTAPSPPPARTGSAR